MTKSSYQQIVEANVSIAESLKTLADNQKQINDFNILHSERSSKERIELFAQGSQERKLLIEKIGIFTTKYWYLLLGTIMGAFALVGVKMFT